MPWPSWPRPSSFFNPLVLRYRIIRAGRPENRFDRLGRRFGVAFGKILLQRCTLKNERPFTGLMHVFIFYGALTFDTLTVNHTLEGFFSNFSLLGHGRFRMFFAVLTDVMAVPVLIGVAFFIVRRFAHPAEGVPDHAPRFGDHLCPADQRDRQLPLL